MTQPAFTPLSIDRVGDRAIEIKWSDGQVSAWTVAELRKACPCATCREKKAGSAAEQESALALPVLSADEARPLKIDSMNPVGQYAYSIQFSDGHSSGIFTFAMLHEGSR